jgi:hypothetical protein
MSAADNQWLVLDHFNQPRGPYTTTEVRVLLQAREFYVCRVGGQEWVLGRTIADIRNHVPGGIEYNLHLSSAPHHQRFQTATDSLLKLCQGFLADNYLSRTEIQQLEAWFEAHGYLLLEWPGNVIAHRVEEILADGIITEEEREDLQKLLEKAAGPKPDAITGITLATRLPLDTPPPEVNLPGGVFVLQVSLSSGHG